MLTREQLLGMTARRYAEPYIDVIGDTIRIVNMTEAERTEYELSPVNDRGDNKKSLMARMKRRLIASCWVDADGNKVLREDDVKQLRDVDGAVTDAIYQACRRHCGFEEGEIEGLVKNYAETPVDVSLSD